MNEGVRVIITGRDYEQYVYDILTEDGYEAELTPESGDKGVDVLVRVGAEKIAIQCKLYSQPVGVEAVQEVHTGSVFYKCTKAFVVSPQPFTGQACDVANAVGVEIVHHDKLLERLSEFRQDDDSADEGNGGISKRDERLIRECEHRRIDELRDRKVKLVRKMAEFQSLSERCKEGDVDALFEMAYSGAAARKAINDELHEVSLGWQKLCLKDETAGMEEAHISYPPYSAKSTLIDMAKDGNRNAQSRLMEFVKGREVDAQVVSVFETAIKNGDEWVQKMKLGLAMYGIGS